KDDDEKPLFAGLRPGQKMDDITLEEALELFKLPRELGTTPEGEPVSANIGRFGPYIRYGDKFVSIRGDDDPYTITLERALELIEEKKRADANRIIKTFDGTDVQILNGRYGPYVTNGAKNAKIPKDREPKSLTLEECEALLEAAPERRGRGKKAAKKKTAAATAAPGGNGADAEAPEPRRQAAKKKAAKKATKKKAKKKAAKKKASARKKMDGGLTVKETPPGD